MSQKPPQVGALSLKAMVQNQLIKNIKIIQDVGGMDYDFCRPFLRCIKNADQLRTIELSSPQIIGKDKEIWAQMIKGRFGKDISDYPRPKKGDYYQLFKSIAAEYDEEKKAHEAKLREQVERLNSDKSKKRAILINTAPASFKRQRIQATGFGRSSKDQNALQKARRETATYTKNMNVAQRYQQGQVRRELNGGRPVVNKTSSIDQIAGRRAEMRGREVVDGSVLQKRTGGVAPTPSEKKGVGFRRG